MQNAPLGKRTNLFVVVDVCLLFLNMSKEGMEGNETCTLQQSKTTLTVVCQQLKDHSKYWGSEFYAEIGSRGTEKF